MDYYHIHESIDYNNDTDVTATKLKREFLITALSALIFAVGHVGALYICERVNRAK